jgi:hypothetical protein
LSVEKQWVQTGLHYRSRRKEKAPDRVEDQGLVVKIQNYILPESSLLALNFATFFAFILMASPVKGLRPFRAARFVTENVPKPTKVSLFPFFNVFVTPSMNEFSEDVACILVMPASSAIFAISSVLFMICFKIKNLFGAQI